MMGVSLFRHNQDAYEAALSMLSEIGKAAVIHPTGTGKSFIGFKLCEDHPDAAVCWLSPSDYIFRTQTENWKCAGGTDLDNITFLTYAKLMNMDESDIAEIRPAFIVLDEFHRAGAEEWSKGVERLLNAYPAVPLLGLSATAIRYLDNQRNMADELFDGNIASEMTLGEAIVRGILHPPKYVVSVFSYQHEYERYCRRVERSQSPWARDKAQQYLDALKRALDKAEGLDVIFHRHMTDRTGKYIVFCANFDHMKSMIDHVPAWFGKIDPAPHIYSVYSYDPTASRAFEEFKADGDDSHLRLLFCIDALNEGIHVDDVSGVILLRPTVSPIIYKQQIGRAMSAGKSKNAVIFDIVDNASGLSSIDSVKEEMEAAIGYFRSLDGDGIVINEEFRVYDEVRECRALFDGIEQVLSAPWEQMYEMAKAYAAENGDLLPAVTYTTPEGYHLGQWLVTQRANYIKKDPSLTPERIALLEAIGMSWKTQKERFWEETYEVARAYYGQHQTLDGLAAYSQKAYAWIVCQRQKYRSDLLTKEQIRLLNAIGMVWECEDTWQIKYEAAREYYRQHGNLDIPANYVTAEGLPLGGWYRSVKNQYRDGLLPEKRIKMLEAIGINWTPVKTRVWMRYYDAAQKYRAENGHADIPADYCTEDGLRLGAWVANQRYGRNQGKLSAEQIRLLEALGLSWQRDDTRWNVGYGYAESYYASRGHLNVPADYISLDGFELGRWLATQRTRRKQGKISEARIARLDRLEICWDPNEAVWQEGLGRLKKYLAANGHVKVPAAYTDDDGYRLGAWLSKKRTQYKKGALAPERVRVLEELGVAWDANEERWQTGYEHALLYFRANGHLRVPQGYVSPDGYELYRWLSATRSHRKAGRLDERRGRLLAELEGALLPRKSFGVGALPERAESVGM